MNPKAATLRKSIKSVFILEKSKISRLLNIIEDKYNSVDFEPISSFEVTLKDRKKIIVSDIEHVLSLDNSVNNPLISLSINYRNSNDDDKSTCEIHYYTELSNYEGFSGSSVIDISIVSSNVRWANELFAEIEEQIERILVKSWIYNLRKYSTIPLFPSLIPLTLLTLIMMIAFLIYSPAISPLSETDFLLKSDIERILIGFQNAKNTDEKIGALSEYYISRLKNMERAGSVSFSEMVHKFDIKILLILLPLFIMLISFYYLFKYCYPGSIFLWGDYEEYYNKIINKRKFIINTIIITLFIGIIGNLFVYAFSKFF
jgi:hypothetical protein